MKNLKPKNPKEYYLSQINETTGMSFEDLKEKYEMHYDSYHQLSLILSTLEPYEYRRYCWGGIKIETDALIDNLQKTFLYLLKYFYLDRDALIYIEIALSNKWHTGDSRLDHEIELYYNMSKMYADRCENRIHDIENDLGRVYADNLLDIKINRREYYKAFNLIMKKTEYLGVLPRLPKRESAYIHSYKNYAEFKAKEGLKNDRETILKNPATKQLSNDTRGWDI